MRALLVAMVSLFSVSAFATSFGINPPSFQAQFCSAETGVLFHPVSGEAVTYYSGCQKTALIKNGFVESFEGETANNKFCTMEVGVVYHPETHEEVGFSNGCEKSKLLDEGYLLSIN
jgi:hypothetical protein